MKQRKTLYKHTIISTKNFWRVINDEMRNERTPHVDVEELKDDEKKAYD